MTGRGRGEERASLHDITPSAIELVEGDFPLWEIWREILPSGEHGDWLAKHTITSCDVVRAGSPEALRELLQQHPLHREESATDVDTRLWDY